MRITRGQNYTYILETDNDTYTFSSNYNLRKKLIMDYKLTEEEIQAITRDDKPTLDEIEKNIATMIDFALDEKQRLTEENDRCDKLLKELKQLDQLNLDNEKLSQSIDEKQNSLVKGDKVEEPKLWLQKELDILDDVSDTCPHDKEVEKVEEVKPNVSIVTEKKPKPDLTIDTTFPDESDTEDYVEQPEEEEGCEIDKPNNSWVNLGVCRRKCRLKEPAMRFDESPIVTRVNYNNIKTTSGINRYKNIPAGTIVGTASYLHFDGIDCKYSDDKGYWSTGKEGNRIIIYQILPEYASFFGEYSSNFKESPYFCKYNCKHSSIINPTEIYEYYVDNYSNEDINLVKLVGCDKKVKYANSKKV